MRLRFSILIALSVLAVNALASVLSIPSGLLPGGLIWTNQVGVVGGIPTVTNVFVTYYPTNTRDDIMWALDNCPSNQVIYLSAGTYTIDSLIQWQFLDHGRGVVVRGAGQGKTVLVFTGNGSFLLAAEGGFNATPTPNSAVDWVSGYDQGSTNLVISCATNILSGNNPITVGSMLFLTQEIDPNLVNPTGNAGDLSADIALISASGSNCYQEQIVRVTAVADGTNLTVWPGIHMTNIQASLNPQAFWTGDAQVGYPTHVERCGIEEMTIVSQNENNPISMTGCYDCWVKNVEFTNTPNSAVSLSRSAHCSVVGCYAHDCQSGGASQTYGIQSFHSSDCLIENNAFYKITAPVVLGGGNSGTVIAYNFCTNMIYGVAPGNMMASISIHGCHNEMILVEGNVGTKAEYDCVWGSGSHLMTFRNVFTGYETNLNGAPSFVMLYQIAATVQATNRYASFIGNILGTPGYSTNYEASLPVTEAQGWDKLIYNLGYFDSNTTNGADTATVTTCWRTGNYDYANAALVWDGDGAKTIPNSLYLAGKPSWFGKLSWPPFDPSSPASADLANIPAGYRLKYGSGPPAPFDLRVTTLRTGTIRN